MPVGSSLCCRVSSSICCESCLERVRSFLYSQHKRSNSVDGISDCIELGPYACCADLLLSFGSAYLDN